MQSKYKFFRFFTYNVESGIACTQGPNKQTRTEGTFS